MIPDDFIDAVVDDDATHLFDGADSGVEPLLTGIGALRTLGADAIGAALPVEGDLVGLGGPPAFNSAALDLGEAALVLDAAGFAICGLLPDRVGAAVTWTRAEAQRRQVCDLGEADRELRTSMLEAAEGLARLDVARWRPEVADQLLNLQHRRVLVTPPGVPSRCADLAARALQALHIVDLGLEDDGGALTAQDAEARRRSLMPLARAGRRALVAAASPEAWPAEA